MLIFLDIDGVLVRESDEFDREEEISFHPDCLALFESVIQDYPCRIVISSAWREEFPLDFIRSRFSPPIAAKVIGATPILTYRRYFRYHEIMSYLHTYGGDEVPWIAIDDIAEHFPPEAPVIVTNPDNGFDGATALQLREFLNSAAS